MTEITEDHKQALDIVISQMCVADSSLEFIQCKLLATELTRNFHPLSTLNSTLSDDGSFDEYEKAIERLFPHTHKLLKPVRSARVN